MDNFRLGGKKTGMYGIARGTMTLLGLAAAGFLIWLASQLEVDENGEYWAMVGLLAAAGLTMALSQLLGGWTKWGWPRISGSVFLLALVPALVAGGIVVLDAQPDGGFGSGWADALGVDVIAEDLAGLLPAIAFGLGLVFGLTFDTTGPRVRRALAPVDSAPTRVREPAAGAEPAPEPPPRAGPPPRDEP